MVEMNEFALVVFLITLCIYADGRTIMMVVLLLCCMYFLTLVNAQQLMLIEGMTTNGDTTSLTVYLLFLVLVVSFLKRVI